MLSDTVTRICRAGLIVVFNAAIVIQSVLCIIMLSTVSCPALTCCRINYASHRLQNSPYFWVSSTREQSNKRSGTRLKTESETGERRQKYGLSVFFPSSRLTRPRGVWGSRASRAWDSYRFLYWFWEKKTDCFAVYASHEYWSHILSMWPTFYIAGIFSKAFLLASLGSDDF